MRAALKMKISACCLFTPKNGKTNPEKLGLITCVDSNRVCLSVPLFLFLPILIVFGTPNKGFAWEACR